MPRISQMLWARGIADITEYWRFVFLFGSSLYVSSSGNLRNLRMDLFHHLRKHLAEPIHFLFAVVVVH